MAIPLILDDTTRARAKTVYDYAHNHRRYAHDIVSILTGQMPPAGADPGHCLMVAARWSVVYSVEQQSKFGWCHHISIRDEKNDKLPTVPVVDEIIKLFDADLFIRDSIVLWDESSALNLLFKHDETRTGIWTTAC